MGQPYRRCDVSYAICKRFNHAYTRACGSDKLPADEVMGQAMFNLFKRGNFSLFGLVK